MKKVKKLIFVCMMALFSAGAFAQTDRGDSSFGIDLGYGFDSENFIIGLDYRYNFTDQFRLAPSVSYFVKKDNLSAWAIDLNAQYVFKLSEMFGFYPLAGIDLSFWKHKIENGAAYGTDTSIDRTRVGANIGLGGELYATDLLSIGLEIKYNIIKDYDQAIIGLRIGYNF